MAGAGLLGADTFPTLLVLLIESLVMVSHFELSAKPLLHRSQNNYEQVCYENL
jgi:hypothetical protein